MSYDFAAKSISSVGSPEKSHKIEKPSNKLNTTELRFKEGNVFLKFYGKESTENEVTNSVTVTHSLDTSVHLKMYHHVKIYRINIFLENFEIFPVR